jgi:hypothetical protein
MKKLITILSVLITTQTIIAAIQIKATAPNIVEVNEQFRLSYTINTQDVDDFNLPELNAFEVDMGPSRSSQSSVQIINGKMTKNSSITYTYILRANQEGDFTIPAATAIIDGEEHQSNSVQIKVLKATSSQQSQSGGQAPRMRTQSAGAQITANDLFIKASVSKKQVYEQEAVLLTYKVYSLVNLSQLSGGIPELEGFHVQEIDLPQQKSFTMEEYNGKNYGVVVWRQYVLFPQKSGKLKIPKVDFDALVVQHNRNIDPFEAFFNGGSSIVEVNKKITAPELTLDIQPLPETTQQFSGAVGQFRIKSDISTTDLKANEALTLKIIVSGTGNMKLMKTPTVNFPTDFETYDAKISDKTKITKDGAVGEKLFEYIAVPRHPGLYSIPPVEFCYFDTKEKTYKTLKTESFSVNIDKSNLPVANTSTNFTQKEDVKLLASDIRYIHLGDVVMIESGQLFGSVKYVLCFIIPLLTFCSLLIIYRKRAKANANISRQRNKKANKVAVKRMKRASTLLNEKQKSEFYDEVLKALWGYIADKLNIPTAELNKDIVKENLTEAGISNDDIVSLLETINECEFARFSSGNTTLENMRNVYNSATTAINKIENSIKK